MDSKHPMKNPTATVMHVQLLLQKPEPCDNADAEGIHKEYTGSAGCPKMEEAF